MPPIHGKQIHFCVGTSHEKFSRSVGTIRTAQFFSAAQYITQGFPMQFSPALRAARTEQPAVAEMPTHPFVHPATRLKP